MDIENVYLQKFTLLGRAFIRYIPTCVAYNVDSKRHSFWSYEEPETKGLFYLAQNMRYRDKISNSYTFDVFVHSPS